jgi:DNA adenine methylase
MHVRDATGNRRRSGLPRGHRRALEIEPAMTSPKRVPAKPFLKWAGGKTQLLEQMRPFVPDGCRTYFEPFLGGGAVFFALAPKRAFLADANAELINAYEMVRDCPVELIGLLEYHSARIDKRYFYEVRRERPEELSPVARAARLIFLNKTCFNGLYRVNSKGEFNVPYGLDYYPGRKPVLYEREAILAASDALRSASLSVADYRAAVASAGRGDFVYLDPPYHPLSATSGFTSYTKKHFGDAEQRELAETFRSLDARGARVLLSNSPTPLVLSLYEGFRVETLKARRAINSKGTGRGEINEILVRNFG